MTEPSIIDLTSVDGEPQSRARKSRAALRWLTAWSAVVLSMAALVSAQKGIPLRYTLVSEGVNYYTLGAIAIAVWLASGFMTANRWTSLQQAVAHLALGLLLISVWQAVYLFSLRLMMGQEAWATQFRSIWMFQLVNACVMYS